MSRALHYADCCCVSCEDLRDQLVLSRPGGVVFTTGQPCVGNPGQTFHSALPVDSALRKTVPMATGCWDYFPAALAAVAELSYWGNEKHNAGEPLHDARSKSTDDADCLLRHFTDRGKLDEITVNGKQIKVRHSTAVAWRALRILQKELEAEGAPLAPGARE